MAKNPTKQGATRPVAILICIWLFPMMIWGGFFAGARTIEQLNYSSSPSQTVLVGERNNDSRLGVDVRIKVGKPALIHTSLTGIITGVSVVAMDSISSGDPLFSVDGMSKFAYYGDTPFYRELTQGDAGSDVFTLISLLKDSGSLSQEFMGDGIFTTEVEQALTEFQSNNGLLVDGVMRPDDFVFIPANFNRVLKVFVEVGLPLPPDGIVAEAEGNAYGVSFVTVSGEELPPAFQNTQVILSSQVEELELSSITPNEDELNELQKAMARWTADGAVHIHDEGVSELIYSGVTLRLLEAFHVGTVPSTSVFVDEYGVSCVGIMDDSGNLSLVITELYTVPGEVGLSGVDSELIGKEVVRDISEQHNGPRLCQSS